MKDIEDKTEMLNLFRNMSLIRKFEQKVSELFLRGVIPGTIHLSFGEEAVAVGVNSVLGNKDVIIPTHRGHGYALSKGMEPWRLFAELFARVDGVCKGKGGSLHIGDMNKGIFPANPVVGSSIPLATGIGFSFMYNQEDRVVVSYFGDGAVNTGPFHEGVNLGAIWNLPILFVCTNNQYAISTPARNVTKLQRLADRAAAYGIPGIQIDGNDVLAVRDAANEAVQQLRDKKGPIFLECLTYRQGGHKRDDSAPYRSKDEVEFWLNKDPIKNFKHYLVESLQIDESNLEEIESQLDIEIEEAVEKALQSPHPPESVAYEDVYA